MPVSTSPAYSRLPMDQQDCRQSSFGDESSASNERSDANLLEKQDMDDIPPKKNPTPNLSTVFNVIFFLVSTVLFTISFSWQINLDRKCLALHSTYSPALKDINPVYKPVKFNGTLDYPSIYRGDPSPEIDAAWDYLTDVRVMSITEAEVLKLGKTTDAIKIPSQFGGGYMASVELNHQLHCVNFLRKSLYPAYYAPPSPYASVEFTDSPSMIATHQGHCLEMLRQFVMCHADVGMITHRWVEGYPRPYPDFNTWHQCRDFDSALQWTKEHQFKEEEGAPPLGWTYVPAEEEAVLEVPP